MARITINGISFDPADRSPAAASVSSVDASKSDYVLVQTTAPLTAEQQAQLKSLGAEICEYVSANTYMCRYKPTDLSPIRALPFVAWANVYLQAFKIPPALRPAAGAAPATNAVPLAQGDLTSRKPRNVDIVLHHDVDSNAAALKARIAAAAHVSPDDLSMSRHKVRLHVQERYLNDLAAIDEVRHIEEVPTVGLFNNVARGIIAADVVINGTSYQGDGEIIAVNDTGFDTGSTADVHPAFAGRVRKLVALGRPNKSDDPAGHGTHVCGSALGDGNSQSMGGAVQGAAPKATLIVQSLLDADGSLGGLPPDLHDLFKPLHDSDNVRIQTNSWGATQPGLPYNQSSREIDDFVWNHQDSVICFAAGNSGADADGDGVIDPGSLGAEAAAKNCITVGASENRRDDLGLTYGRFNPSSFPHDPIFGDSTTNHHEGMAAFSSRGPTREGRVKPDVVAPGTSILSTRSRDVVTPPTVFGTSSDPAFFFDDGTSMATPLVAGCVAVMRETLVKNGTADPPAALIKALLVNGAVDLPGQYNPSEAGPSPNGSSGWGRVDLAGSIAVPGANQNRGFGQGGPLQQGQSNTVTVKIPGQGASTTFKITLVWSDPPGALLQNDLDLIVQAANGEERHGNMGTGTGFDRRNNVEQVVWTNMPPGDAKITIRAFHITQFPQPYAFAWRLS
jgi:serine protease AprX